MVGDDHRAVGEDRRDPSPEAGVPHRAVHDLGLTREAREARYRRDAAEAGGCLKRYNLDAPVRERLKVDVECSSMQQSVTSCPSVGEASGEVDELSLAPLPEGRGG